MVKPKKFLGQHFLHDKNIARKITEILKPAATIIEVGAGTGALSYFLYERFGKNVFFVDIDQEAIYYLKESLKISSNQLLQKDFLTIDISTFQKPIHIIGNFPYNISSQLMFKILEHKDTIEQVVCMLQKEVAQRIASKEGSKNYGILSVLIQTYYHVRYHFQVNETVFTPPPKVKSAVIELVKKKDFTAPIDEDFFKTIVKTAFNQRRKILSNSLSAIIEKSQIPEKYMSQRPEMLSVADFLELSNNLYLKIHAPS